MSFGGTVRAFGGTVRVPFLDRLDDILTSDTDILSMWGNISDAYALMHPHSGIRAQASTLRHPHSGIHTQASALRHPHSGIRAQASSLRVQHLLIITDTALPRVHVAGEVKTGAEPQMPSIITDMVISHAYRNIRMWSCRRICEVALRSDKTTIRGWNIA